MRNLKKVLALVLSLVMALSLVTVAGAATFEETFTDASSVSKDYVTAVKVVNGLKVFQGQSDTEFAPNGTFNRAQLAGLAYRIDTGDIAGYGKDSSGRYVQSGTFYDVPDDAWYAGYVGYCYGAGLISGRGNGSYDPMTPVTGTDVLAILLHLVGYKDLFKGANWSIEVASKAQQLGLLDKVVTANDLTGAASRELVCELSFRTLTQAEMVQKNTATEGYLTLHNLIPGVNTGVANKSDGIDKDITLGEQKFKLVQDSETVEFDEWGRPAIGWYKADSITYSGSGFAGQSTKTVTIKATTKPFVKVACAFTKSYETADTECEIYEDLGLTATTNTFELWVNGQNATNSYKIDKLDTRTMVGGQNRLTEVYMNYDGAGTNRIVMIDTYLALVRENNEATYDSNSSKTHVRTPAHMVLTVFDAAPAKVETIDNYLGSTTNYVLDNDPETEPWEYEVGTMLLINAVSPEDDVEDDGQAAAYTTYPVDAGDDLYAEIKGEAAYVDAAQDQWRRNATFHKVDGAQYDDSMTFCLDDCGNNVKNDFRWWLDGTNLMGVTVLKSTSDYGVITKLWFVDGRDGESGITYADVSYSNGEAVKKVQIDEFVVQAKTSDYTKANVADGALGAAMSVTAKKADPVPLSLTPVHGDASGENAMQLKADILDTGKAKGKSAADWAELYVSTDYKSNADAKGKFGMIYGQLFKFVTGSDGSVVAWEVAGNGDLAPAKANLVYKGMSNGKCAWDTSKGQEAQFITGQHTYTIDLDGVNDGTTATLRLSSTTNILVAADGKAPTAYVGYKTMPTLKTGVKEVDWVDVNGDGFADHVFIIGNNATSEKDVLFFYDHGYSGLVDKKNNVWEIEGWIDGEEATLLTKSETLYDTVTETDGVLWALRTADGYATDIFYPTKANGDANTKQTLKDLTAAGKLLSGLKDSTSTKTFKATYNPLSTVNDSIYPATTQVLYKSAADVVISSTGTGYRINGLVTGPDGDYTLVARDGSTLNDVLRAYRKDAPAFNLFVVSNGGLVSQVYIISTKAVTPEVETSDYRTDIDSIYEQRKGATKVNPADLDAIQTALADGDVILMSSLNGSGTITIPANRVLQVMGDVPATVKIEGEATSVLMVSGTYTTNGDTKRIDFDVRAQEVNLGAGTKIYGQIRTELSTGVGAAGTSGNIDFAAGTYYIYDDAVVHADHQFTDSGVAIVHNYGKVEAIDNTTDPDNPAPQNLVFDSGTSEWHEYANTLTVAGLTVKNLKVRGTVEVSSLTVTSVTVQDGTDVPALLKVNGNLTLDSKYTLTSGTIQVASGTLTLAGSTTLTKGSIQVDTGKVSVTASETIPAGVSLTVSEKDVEIADGATLTVKGSLTVEDGEVKKSSSTGSLKIDGTNASVTSAGGVDVGTLAVDKGTLNVEEGTVKATTFEGSKNGSIELSKGVKLDGAVKEAVGTGEIGGDTTLTLSGDTSGTQIQGSVTSSSSSASKNLGSVRVEANETNLLAYLHSSTNKGTLFEKTTPEQVHKAMSLYTAAPTGDLTGNVLKVSGAATWKDGDNTLAQQIGNSANSLIVPLVFTIPAGSGATQFDLDRTYSTQSTLSDANSEGGFTGSEKKTDEVLDDGTSVLVLLATGPSTKFVKYELTWKNSSGEEVASSTFIIDLTGLTRSKN